MKIERVELFHVSIPLPKPFYPTWIPGYPQTHNNFDLIKLTTDDGITGWSAGVSMGRERQGLGKLLGPYIMGMDASDLAKVNQRIKEASYLGWRNAWIEAAFWDIIGKSKGKPVYELLGGTARELPAYCSTGELHEPEKRAEEVLRIRDMGFGAVKLRVKTNSLEQDILQVETVRKALGDDYTIAVDANQGWLVTVMADIKPWDIERAVNFSNACYDLGVAWLEEPIDSRDYDAYSELRKRTKVKIAGAELNHGWDEIKIFFEKKGLDIYQPDPSFNGMSVVKTVIHKCTQEGLEFSPHTWTNGIGFMISLNMALAHVEGKMPIEYPFEPPGWVPEARDGILAEPIEVSPEGKIKPPTMPGLGFEIDEKALKRYGKRFYVGTPARVAVGLVKEKGVKIALPILRQRLKDRK